MQQRLALLALAFSVLASVATNSLAADGNRLAYLDENNPWYPHTDFPKLTTPQWVGEEGVEAVVVLAIDDMRDTAKYEAYLRPILQRLKQIDGRAPVSIMTCNVKPDDPQLQSWLAEGLSIEVHTVDHPCPLLQGGDFAKAKSTYDRCIDLLHQIPGNRPVAFRMPCCDSLNTVSPRFFSEIFNSTTPEGNHLSISSSVFTLFTSADKSIPRELVLNEDGTERFRRYLPKGLKRGGVEHNHFLNWIENYPYPYVINGKCWEFPCVVPSDWSAQFLQQPNNPKTVEDWKAALDITVHKQGVFNLVFHPHGWIKAEQVVELIDHAVAKHGKKVKFLTFREAEQRLRENLTVGSALKGIDRGVRVLDVNNDGFMDVIAHRPLDPTFKDPTSGQAVIRLWSPDDDAWEERPFPVPIIGRDGQGYPIDRLPRFGCFSKSGEATMFITDSMEPNFWTFKDGEWAEDRALRKSFFNDGLPDCDRAPKNSGTGGFTNPARQVRFGDEVLAQSFLWRATTLRDVDNDGITEVLVPIYNDGFRLLRYSVTERRFRDVSDWLPSVLRHRTQPSRTDVRDAMPWLRFVDLNGDGCLDIVFSESREDEREAGIWLFDATDHGWTKEVVYELGHRYPKENQAGLTADTFTLLPPLDEGFFVQSGFLAWQNENTDHLPDLVHKVSIDDLLAEHQRREARLKLPPVPVGAAKVDITPDYPVRLSGYGNRMTESEGVAHRIHARALAIGGEDSHKGTKARSSVASAADDRSAVSGSTHLSLLLTVDTCGVPTEVTERVFGKIAEKTPLRREHFAISSTHSHSAPWLMGFAPNLFAEVPDDHRARLQRYENELVEKLVTVAQQAIEKRRPGRLSVAHGNVGFARNRRVLQNGQWKGFGVQGDGPVDHRLPVLAAHDTAGNLIALLATYACHCTTETGSFNEISGDWAGFAAEFIEAEHPNSVALISIGAGADANPEPRGTHERSKQHGRELADEVKRLLSVGWVEPREAHQTDGQGRTTNDKQRDGGPRFTRPTLQLIDPTIVGRMARVDLPLGPLPTRDEWEQRAKEGGTRGSHARRFLELLDRGEEIPTTVPDYPVQTWCFGDDLAMVFLGGEVVVDYALRMNDTFDGDRLWLNAYSNDVPCYIASKRVLQEGGYEADFSMIYYARPTRLAPETEDIIVDTVQKLLPPEFYSEETQQNFPAPKSPEDSAACIQVKPGLKVELVAAEPLITDPVAFDWDIQGRLWVVEMGDYPGEGNSEQGAANSRKGRIRVLTDVDGDGRYDEATTFLDDIAFPSGICLWRNGVLVTAAPDIFYAEDTDGDGRADVRTTLYSGFGEGNQQHRVNGLQWGLDGWVHVGNGDSGGEIRNVAAVLESDGNPDRGVLNVSGRDLRIRPDTGEMEAASGQTQFGRARDDWGNWFGNNNSNPIWHYVLDERDLRRNPHAPVSTTKAMIAVEPGAAPVFPISRTLARYNDFSKANRFTSACSTTIYRDDLLGEEFYGDAFVCEPVHNLVSRLVLTPDGVTFKAERSPNERDSEFFASSDNWTRPVMVRTGPDGALWVADMYRFVIEHPKWIPAEQQRKVNLYAGSDRGRIYRIVRESNSACCGAAEPSSGAAATSDSRAWLEQKWDDVPVEKVTERLASPNGWWRDAAHRIVLHRNDEIATDAVAHLAGAHASPQVRLQALHLLQSLAGQVPVDLLNDPDPRVRAHAIRLAAMTLRGPAEDDATLEALLRLQDDEAPVVQFQLASSLGEIAGEDAAQTLGRLAVRNATNPWITAAVFSSLNGGNVEAVLGAVLRASPESETGDLAARLLGQAVALGKVDAVGDELVALLPTDEQTLQAETWRTAERILSQLRSSSDNWQRFSSRPEIQERLTASGQLALNAALANDADEALRLHAIRFAGVAGTIDGKGIRQLAALLVPSSSVALQTAVVSAIAAGPGEVRAETLLAGWRGYSPAIRSQVAEALLSRRAWTGQLLAAIEEATVAPTDLDAARRERLLTHREAAIRERAAKLFESSVKESSRQAVVEEHRAALELVADAARGRAVFEKRCSACHKVGELGKSIGADLMALRDRSGEALLTAILDPNRAVEAKFLSYIAVTKDGRSFSGMLLSETGNSLTLIGTDGKEQTLLRSNLEELVATNRSLMPEGFEKDVSPQDLADVIAFVQSSGVKWKSFSGNQPRTISAADDGSLLLPANAAEIYGPSLILEEKYGNLGWWSSTDDYAVWSIEAKSSGFYRVELEYACHYSTSGSPIRFSTGTRLLTARVPGTGTWDNYRTWSAGEIDLRRGVQQLTVSAPIKPSQALIDLKSIRLVPVD